MIKVQSAPILLSLTLLSLTACEHVTISEPTDLEMERDFRAPEGSLRDIMSNDNLASDTWRPNLYLWQASLQTIGFMGIKSVFPETGTLVTEWFVNDKNSAYETQVTVSISGDELLSNNINLGVARRDRKTGLAVSSGLSSKLRDAILAKARDLRIKDGS